MKKNGLQRNLALTMAAVMALSLTACGTSSSNTGSDKTTVSGDGQQTASMPADPADLKGSIIVGGWPSGDDGFKAALNGFHDKYPNIEVDFQLKALTLPSTAIPKLLPIFWTSLSTRKNIKMILLL